jgi:3-hydroxyisobutyrate dehydrogenase-like beta-hydroxyacid dehydrogenase
MVLAEMGTLPLEAKEAARVACAEVGVALLDCPVSGTGAQAATGDLVVFASGEAADVAVLYPVFSALARDIRHVGPFGAGMKLKLVANLLVTIHNLAAAEALLLAEKSGLDLGMVYEAIRSGAGNSRMFEVRGPLMIDGRYEPATMKMDVYQKDLALIMDPAYRKIVQKGRVQEASALRCTSIACLCKTIGIGRQIAGYMMQACSRRHMYGSSSGALDAREKAVSFAG